MPSLSIIGDAHITNDLRLGLTKKSCADTTRNFSSLVLKRFSEFVLSFDFRGGEGGGEDDKFVDAAVEIADGSGGGGLDDGAPVSDLGWTEVDGRVGGVVIAGGGDFPAIDVVGDVFVLMITDDREVDPSAEIAHAELAVVGEVEDAFLVGRFDAEVERSILFDLPVDVSIFEGIGEEDGVEGAVEAIDADPGHHGDGLVGAGDVEADPVIGLFELESRFPRPTTLSPLAADDGTVEFF